MVCLRRSAAKTAYQALISTSTPEGKSNLLGLLGFPELNSHTYNWIALLDKDYDQILNRQSTVSNLVYTDLNDLEVTLLCICSSRNHLLINKILNVSIDTEKQINFESKIGVPVVEHIRQITSNYGVLRFINEKNQYGVNFDNLPFCTFRYLVFFGCNNINYLLITFT